jgi:hypothetical protein
MKESMSWELLVPPLWAEKRRIEVSTTNCHIFEEKKGIRFFRKSEIIESRLLFSEYVDEVVQSDQADHTLDSFLEPEQLEGAATLGRSTVQVGQTSNGGAIHILNAPEVEEELFVAFLDELGDGVGKGVQRLENEPFFLDTDDLYVPHGINL